MAGPRFFASVHRKRFASSNTSYLPTFAFLLATSSNFLLNNCEETNKLAVRCTPVFWSPSTSLGGSSTEQKLFTSYVINTRKSQKTSRISTICEQNFEGSYPPRTHCAAHSWKSENEGFRKYKLVQCHSLSSTSSSDLNSYFVYCTWLIRTGLSQRQPLSWKCTPSYWFWKEPNAKLPIIVSHVRCNGIWQPYEACILKHEVARFYHQISRKDVYRPTPVDLKDFSSSASLPCSRHWALTEVRSSWMILKLTIFEGKKRRSLNNLQQLHFLDKLDEIHHVCKPSFT